MAAPVAPESYPRMRWRMALVRLRQWARRCCDLTGLGPATADRLCCVLILAAAMLGVVLAASLTLRVAPNSGVTYSAFAFLLTVSSGFSLILVGNDADLASERQRLSQGLSAAKAAWEDHKEKLRAERAQQREGRRAGEARRHPEEDKANASPPPRTPSYTFDDLVVIYRRYAELKGWNTTEDVIRDKVESWCDSHIGPVGLAIAFHEEGKDGAKHLGHDAEARAVDAGIQSQVVTLAGTQHANADGTSRQAIFRHCAPLEALRVRHEPDNRFDPNAVAISRENGQQLGYLPRKVAAETVSRMKAQYKHAAFLKAVEPGRSLRVDIGTGESSMPQDVTIVLFILEPDVPASEWEASNRSWLAKMREAKK